MCWSLLKESDHFKMVCRIQKWSTCCNAKFRAVWLRCFWDGVLKMTYLYFFLFFLIHNFSTELVRGGEPITKILKTYYRTAPGPATWEQWEVAFKISISKAVALPKPRYLWKPKCGVNVLHMLLPHNCKCALPVEQCPSERSENRFLPGCTKDARQNDTE